MKFLNRSISLILVYAILISFTAQFRSAQAQSPTGRVRVKDRILTPGGQPRAGKVTFVLLQAAQGPDGLIPAKTSVTAETNNGWFDVWIYPSTSINPQGYYNVLFQPSGSVTTENLGVYSFPSSNSILTLAPNLVTDTNLAARYKLAADTTVQNLAATAGAAGGVAGAEAGAAATQAALAGSLANGAVPKWDAAQGKFVSAIPNSDSLLMGRSDGSAGYVRLQDIAFPSLGNPVVQGLPLTGGNLTGAVTSGSTIDAGVPSVAYSALPSTPTTHRRFFVSSGPTGLAKDFYSYDTNTGFWIPEHGGQFVASFYAAGSTTGGIKEAYLAMGAAGGTVILDRDITISTPSVINVVQGKLLTINGNHRKLSFNHTTGIGLHIKSAAGESGPYSVENLNILYTGTSTGITGLKIGATQPDPGLVDFFIRNCTFDQFKQTNNTALELSGVQKAAVVQCTFKQNYKGLLLTWESNDVLIDRCGFDAQWNDPQDYALKILDSGIVTIRNTIFQSNRTMAPLVFQASSTFSGSLGNWTIDNCYWENNGTNDPLNAQILLQNDSAQPMRDLNILNPYFGGGVPATAGNQGSIIRATGVGLRNYQGIGGYWGARPNGRFVGNNDVLGFVVGTNNESPATVRINSGARGIAFGDQNSTTQFQMYAGAPGDYDNYFQIWDLTNSKRLIMMNPSLVSFNQGLIMRGYNGLLADQKWELDSATGNANFVGDVSVNKLSTLLNGVQLAGTGGNGRIIGNNILSVDSDYFWVRNKIGGTTGLRWEGNKLFIGDSLDTEIARDAAGIFAVKNGSGSYRDIKGRQVIITDTLAATATAGAATVNSQTGTITSESLTTAAGAAYTLTITNSKISASSVVTASFANGTNTQGTLALGEVTPSAGAVSIVVRNTHATQSLNGTIKISYISF